MVRLALIAVALCLAALPAQADQCGGSGAELSKPTLCSKTFEFHGQCGVRLFDYAGWDDVALAVGAWERKPIRIIIASTQAAVVGGKYAKLFAGNSFDADLMTPERTASGAGDSIIDVHAEEHFPAGFGLQFPAGLPMPDTHLDVHLYCVPVLAKYTGSLTVWYTIDDDTRASVAEH